MYMPPFCTATVTPWPKLKGELQCLGSSLLCPNPVMFALEE